MFRGFYPYLCVQFLTQLLQRRHPILVSVVFRNRGHTSTHEGVRQSVHGHLGWIHSTDQGLETLVGERRLPAIELYDPGVGGGGAEMKTIIVDASWELCRSVLFTHFVLCLKLLLKNKFYHLVIVFSLKIPYSFNHCLCFSHLSRS